MNDLVANAFETHNALEVQGDGLLEGVCFVFLFIGAKMFDNDHTTGDEGIALHQHAPQLEALGLEYGIFVFRGGETWKDLFDEVGVCVCECPLNTKLSLIGYNEHLVFLGILILSNRECDCDCLRLFQAIGDGFLGGAIGNQLCPCLLHAKARSLLCSE